MNPWATLAQDLLDDQKGLGVVDVNDALSTEADEAWKKEKDSCRYQEAVWRPYTTRNDVVQMVEPSTRGKERDSERARELLNSVRKECVFFLARLRSIVLAMTQRSTYHGLPRGRDISERMLVESVASMRAGKKPRRAYYDVGTQVDVSLSCVVLVDESSSMMGDETETTRSLLTIASPLDSLGCPTLILGFRDGPRGQRIGGVPRDCHRTEGVCIDVFKGFHESFTSTRWRFANVRAVGGTPMSDGIQMGLKALEDRDETHRIMFVITDGYPNSPHRPVVLRQIRLAKEAGIHMVGVGIGNGSTYVKTLFPDHVWVARVSDLPMALSKKLNLIMDWRGLTRRTVKWD